MKHVRSAITSIENMVTHSTGGSPSGPWHAANLNMKTISSSRKVECPLFGFGYDTGMKPHPFPYATMLAITAMALLAGVALVVVVNVAIYFLAN